MAAVSDDRFSVETHESGQRRPYGDSHFHWTITSKGDATEEEARAFAVALNPRTDGTYFKVPDSPFEPRMTVFREINPGQYEVRKVKPSTH